MLVLGHSHGQYLQLPPEVLRFCTWQRRRAWAVGTDQLLARRRGDDADSSVALGRAAFWQGCGFVNPTVLCKRTRRCGSRPHSTELRLPLLDAGCGMPTTHSAHKKSPLRGRRLLQPAVSSHSLVSSIASPVDRVGPDSSHGHYLCIMLTKRASGSSGQAPTNPPYKAYIYSATPDDGLVSRHNVLKRR